MLGFIKHKKKRKLEGRLGETNALLALTKVELAAQMVKLAGQTQDLAPLQQAEDSLSAARNHYTFDQTPAEVGLVYIALGDALMKLGQAKKNKAAISRARDAYRRAITLASMTGDDLQREALRDKVRIAESLIGLPPETQSLFRVA